MQISEDKQKQVSRENEIYWETLPSTGTQNIHNFAFKLFKYSAIFRMG
jgi:hypothetical protein